MLTLFCSRQKFSSNWREKDLSGNTYRVFYSTIRTLSFFFEFVLLQSLDLIGKHLVHVPRTRMKSSFHYVFFHADDWHFVWHRLPEAIILTFLYTYLFKKKHVNQIILFLFCTYCLRVNCYYKSIPSLINKHYLLDG